ncbi:MAG: hypothetical protein NVSMB70_05950 [Chamaesiphon sp.]
MISVIFCSWVGFAQSPQPSVRLTTHPSIHQIRPLEAEATKALGSGQYKPPVQLSLQAVDAQGQALKDARIHLQIFTPSKNPWFTTDFPIVEGTKLLDLEGNAPKGKLQVQQTLPIRGTYQLLVNVTPIAPNAFTPIEQILTLTMPENRAKYLNLGILAAILLVAGLGGGWIIGGMQPIQIGEIVPQRVRLLLSGAIVLAIVALLGVNISAELAESHMSMPMSHETENAPVPSKPAKLQSQGLEMQLSGDTSATVGQPAKLQVSVITAKNQQPVTDVAFKITTTQLENNWVAFAYEGTPDSTEKLAWQQEFFDGAPHSIEVEVAPQANATRKFQPFQVAQNIQVEGVAPPLYVRLISLTYFTSIVVLGLLLGLGIQRYRQKRSGVLMAARIE